MKPLYLFIVLFLCAGFANAQDTTKQGGATVSAYSQLSYTKKGFDPAFWASYDTSFISVEARYNYDWSKNVGLYFGLALKHNNWKFRLMQGITGCNTNTGISISPLIIYDGDKIFVYNNLQTVINIENMPTYYFHWGEIYYKPFNFFWFGISDRIYYDNEKSKDISFGPQVLFAYKAFFVNLYYYIPTPLTENRFSVLVGYEKEFGKPKKR